MGCRVVRTWRPIPGCTRDERARVASNGLRGDRELLAGLSARRSLDSTGRSGCDFAVIFFPWTSDPRPSSCVEKLSRWLASISVVLCIRFEYIAQPANWLIYPFYFLIVAGFASVIYSFWGLTKYWFVHCIHLFTVSYGLVIFYLGSLYFDPVD
jgi:hypothetical protein